MANVRWVRVWKVRGSPPMNRIARLWIVHSTNAGLIGQGRLSVLLYSPVAHAINGSRRHDGYSLKSQWAVLYLRNFLGAYALLHRP